MRITERKNNLPEENYIGQATKDYDSGKAQNPSDSKRRILKSMANPSQTIGWTDCHCNAGWAPGITFDPFSGAGTTAKIAKQLGKHFVGVEIKKEYVEMSEKRLQNVQLELMT